MSEKLKPCPNPGCNGKADIDPYGAKGMVRCSIKDCWFCTNIMRKELWQSLPRPTDAPGEVWVRIPYGSDISEDDIEIFTSKPPVNYQWVFRRPVHGSPAAERSQRLKDLGYDSTRPPGGCADSLGLAEKPDAESDACCDGPEDWCCPYHGKGGDPDLGCFTVEPAAERQQCGCGMALPEATEGAEHTCTPYCCARYEARQWAGKWRWFPPVPAAYPCDTCEHCEKSCTIDPNEHGPCEKYKQHEKRHGPPAAERGEIAGLIAARDKARRLVEIAVSDQQDRLDTIDDLRADLERLQRGHGDLYRRGCFDGHYGHCKLQAAEADLSRCLEREKALQGELEKVRVQLRSQDTLQTIETTARTRIAALEAELKVVKEQTAVWDGGETADRIATLEEELEKTRNQGAAAVADCERQIVEQRTRITTLEKSGTAWAERIHPDYGSCDALGEDGLCSECLRRFSTQPDDSCTCGHPPGEVCEAHQGGAPNKNWNKRQEDHEAAVRFAGDWANDPRGELYIRYLNYLKLGEILAHLKG